jgi:signal peptidase I
MIEYNNTAIEAVNSGTDTPDAFYLRSTLVATSKWISTDGWRGYTKIVPEPGFKEVEASWLTGDWSDAPAGHSESEVEAKIEALEAEYGDVVVIFAPTSNVFSTSYAVIVRDKSTPLAKGKNVGHKTKLFEEADGSWRVKYHATDVISFNAKDQSYTLNSGGWLTKTTKERINQYLPGDSYISQKNFEWTVHYEGESIPFEDGMVLN